MVSRMVGLEGEGQSQMMVGWAGQWVAGTRVAGKRRTDKQEADGHMVVVRVCTACGAAPTAAVVVSVGCMAPEVCARDRGLDMHAAQEDHHRVGEREGDNDGQLGGNY